jgi:hypothetical protein
MKELLQLQTLLHIHSQNLAHFEPANHRESRKFIHIYIPQSPNTKKRKENKMYQAKTKIK